MHPIRHSSGGGDRISDRQHARSLIVCVLSLLQVMLHAPLLRSFYLGEGHDPGTCRLTARDKPCLSCQMVSNKAERLSTRVLFRRTYRQPLMCILPTPVGCVFGALRCSLRLWKPGIACKLMMRAMPPVWIPECLTAVQLVPYLLLLLLGHCVW